MALAISDSTDPIVTASVDGWQMRAATPDGGSALADGTSETCYARCNKTAKKQCREGEKMSNDVSRRASLIVGLVGTLLVGGRIVPAQAQSGDVIQSQDTNFSGIIGEITQVKRKDGVLTIKLRLRNTSGKDARLKIIDGRDFDSYYVTAGDKKYFVLRDTEDTPLMPAVDGSGIFQVGIEKDGAYTWWAKYPAPPAEVTSITYYTPLAAPFEDIPITD
jgi:hypothetical protein